MREMAHHRSPYIMGGEGALVGVVAFFFHVLHLFHVRFSYFIFICLWEDGGGLGCISTGRLVERMILHLGHGFIKKILISEVSILFHG